MEQAGDRECNRVRCVDDYFTVRRHTLGLLPCLDMLQLGMDLPDSVVNHPQVEELTTIAIDMLIIENVSTSLRYS